MNSLLMIKFNINILFVFSSYLTIGLSLAGVGLGAPTKDKSAFCRNSPKKYFFFMLVVMAYNKVFRMAFICKLFKVYYCSYC